MLKEVRFGEALEDFDLFQLTLRGLDLGAARRRDQVPKGAALQFEATRLHRRRQRRVPGPVMREDARYIYIYIYISLLQRYIFQYARKYLSRERERKRREREKERAREREYDDARDAKRREREREEPFISWRISPVSGILLKIGKKDVKGTPLKVCR